VGSVADVCDSAVLGVGFWLLACWDSGFESLTSGTDVFVVFYGKDKGTSQTSKEKETSAEKIETKKKKMTSERTEKNSW
jgi:hypothetical protein